MALTIWKNCKEPRRAPRIKHCVTMSPQNAYAAWKKKRGLSEDVPEYSPECINIDAEEGEP